MSAAVERLELDSLNDMFERQHPLKIIEWTVGQFGDEVAMTSSFGDQAAVLLHLVTRVKSDIRIIFIDTGYLFPETHLYMQQLRRLMNLNVWTYRTRNDPIAYLHQAGEENHTWRRDIEACCAANKNEPLERAMNELAPRAYFRGIRRDQAESRKTARFIQWSARYGCYAVSPLLNWTRRDIGLYMKEHKLPHHPLVEKGYQSIGCNPISCTRPVELGADPRSGRWAGTGKLECGINSLDSSQL
jgi:phosphoadenosine phosphosulfate reductase